MIKYSVGIFSDRKLGLLSIESFLEIGVNIKFIYLGNNPDPKIINLYKKIKIYQVA